MERTFSMRQPSGVWCFRPNWRSKLMRSWRQIWLKLKRKSARMMMSTTLNCGTSSSKRLNWPRERRPPARVSPRRSKSASASSSKRRTSSTSSEKTWSERSKKWQSAWIYPWRSRKKSLGFRKLASLNTISKRHSTYSRSSTWPSRHRARTRKNANWSKSSKSKKLRLLMPIVNLKPSTRRKSETCPPKSKNCPNKSSNSKISSKMKSKIPLFNARNGTNASKWWSVNCNSSVKPKMSSAITIRLFRNDLTRSWGRKMRRRSRKSRRTASASRSWRRSSKSWRSRMNL